MTLAEGRPRVTPVLVLVGLVIAYLPTWLPSAARLVGHDLPAWGPAGVIVWNWLAVGLLLAHVLGLERLGWESLRLVPPTERDLSIAGYLGGAAALWSWGASFLLPESTRAQADAGQGTLVQLGVLLALALVITTAVTEEILLRGYAVERVGAWIGAIPASLIGLAVFSVSHVTFFGPGWLLTHLPGAALLYVLLLWRRNLWAGILAHAVMNIPIVFVALVS